MAMNANWNGILGPNIKRVFGHSGKPVLSGLVGGKRAMANSPFALTEEFTSVYRMHPLLRDDMEIRNVENGRKVDRVSLFDMTFDR